MSEMIAPWQDAARVLDVGSFDVNGNFRALITRHGWEYTGLDICAGRNVDIVTDDPYRFPFESGIFDIVITGSTMEHVQAVWLWVPELVRCLRPGGLLAIHTHMAWMYHPHPFDCWRIMPDGMEYLFDLTGQLERYTIRQIATTRYACLKTDIAASAWKRTDL
jgi:SAM-dependent methyltransferase